MSFKKLNEEIKTNRPAYDKKLNELLERIQGNYFSIDGDRISINRGFGTVSESLTLISIAEAFEELGFNVYVSNFYIRVKELPELLDTKESVSEVFLQRSYDLKKKNLTCIKALNEEIEKLLEDNSVYYTNLDNDIFAGNNLITDPIKLDSNGTRYQVTFVDDIINNDTKVLKGNQRYAYLRNGDYYLYVTDDFEDVMNEAVDDVTNLTGGLEFNIDELDTKDAIKEFNDLGYSFHIVDLKEI